MTERNYRGGKTRRRDDHGQPDIPVSDAPLEQSEVQRVSMKDAVPLLEGYRKTARRGTNRKALERHRQRTEVWLLWCSGKPPAAIARTMNISVALVAQHIGYFRDNLEEGLRAVPVITGAEIVLHYQNIYHESMEAWERSKLPANTSQRNEIRRATVNADGTETQDTTNNSLRQQQRDGDPRFLERAQVALDRIALIQGQVRPGTMSPLHSATATQQTQQNTTPRAQLYLPHNGRDDPDGQVLDHIPPQETNGNEQATDARAFHQQNMASDDGAGVRAVSGG
jgi:hypothetical protein